MFSPFRARRPEGPRSGGKVLQGRRRAVSASPYARPVNSPPPPGPQAGNPKWFSGIITGAGRLLSSVFRSDSGESSSSDSSDAEAVDPGSSDEDENADARAIKFHELDETGRSCKSITAHGDASQLTAQRSERKLAIEKILLQESFSRDEGDRLIKIIQSRVVDNTEGGAVAGQMELPDRTVYSDVTFLGTWRSLNRGRKFPGGRAYSSAYMDDLSPGTSVLRAYSHDLCGKAITEAKKWLEKKKMESASKCEPDSGPCTLNTDVLQQNVEDEVGSPVDIAKSYMQARPPWQSPILSSIGFKTQPTGTLLFKDETPYTVRGDSFSLSKLQTPKRNHLDTDFNDMRSVRLKSMENPSDSAMFQQVGSSTRMSEHEAQQTADETNSAMANTNHDLNSLSAIEASKPVDDSAGTPEMLAVEDRCPEVILSSSDDRAVEVINSNSLPSSEITKLVYSSASMPAKLSTEEGCPKAICTSHDKKTFEVNHSTNDEVNTGTDRINEACNLSSTNFIPDSEDNVDGLHLNREISTQTVLPPEIETGRESLSSGSDCPDLHQSGGRKDLSLGHESTDILIIETSQDLEEASPVENQVNSVSLPNEFSSPESSPNHNDARDAVVELFNIEQELASEGVKSPSPSNISRSENNSKIHASGVHITTEIRQEHRSPQLELPAFEVNDTQVDMRLLGGKGEAEKDVISPTGFTANGNLSTQPGSSSNPRTLSLRKSSRHLPTSSGGGSGTTLPAETRQRATNATVDVPVGRGTGGKKKPQNGTTMKSIEQMLAENSPNSKRSRGRRVAAKLKRGRTRGK